MQLNTTLRMSTHNGHETPMGGTRHNSSNGGDGWSARNRREVATVTGSGVKLYDTEAERSVALGALSLGDDALHFLADLDPSHFYDPLARHALNALIALQDDRKPINSRLAAEWLNKQGLLEECGGVGAFMTACQDAQFHLGPEVLAELYKKVKDRAHARELYRTAERAMSMLSEGKDAASVAMSMTTDVEASSAETSSAPVIEFLSPSQLRDFNPPNGWNLVGDFHLQRGAVTVIGGAPGIGKSRAAIALAVAGAQGAGAQWFGMPVMRLFRTMVIQTENGRVRLKRDFDALDIPELDEFLCVCTPPPYGLRFDRPEFRAQLRRAVRRFKPDVVVLDPWNAVASEDKQKDYMAAFDAVRSVLPTGDDRPALVIVAHTRKPNAAERTSGAGLLATLAGSYVLGSVPRAAFVVQRASNDTMDRKLVWTCCKNNDGEMGQRTAWQRANGLFEAVFDFDWKAFDDVDKGGKRKIEEEHMEEAFSMGKPMTKPEAVSAIIAQGFQRSAAYEAIKGDGRFSDHLSDQGGLLSWK